jgi:ATP-dependent Clp protease ATP-binding subunit ClpB
MRRRSSSCAKDTIPYGARPLKRTIRRRVLDALAMRILDGEFVEGDTVTIDALAGGLRFEKRAAVTA